MSSSPSWRPRLRTDYTNTHKSKAQKHNPNRLEKGKDTHPHRKVKRNTDSMHIRTEKEREERKG